MKNDREPGKKKVSSGATLSSKDSAHHLFSSSSISSATKKRIDERKRKLSEDRNSWLAVKTYEHPSYYPQILELLRLNGVPVSSYKDKYLERRVKYRMSRLRLSSFRDYFDLLVRSEEEIMSFRTALSINVTRFLRNRDSWDFIRDHVLFPLFAKMRDVRIWSAGCAVGAEPYSIAILCESLLRTPGTKVEILATDVNPDFIEQAKDGVYSPPYLAEISSEETSMYFEKNRDGNYEVKDVLREMVEFRIHSLVTDDFPGDFDIIMCRNVMIYIDPAKQEEIYQNFINSLSPGGYLILGRTELLSSSLKSQVTQLSGPHRIYRKN